VFRRDDHCVSLFHSPVLGYAVFDIGPERWIMAAGNFIKKALYCSAVFLCILSIGSASASLGYLPAGAIQSRYGEIDGQDQIPKILSVLEIRSCERIIIDKAAEKLSAMNKRDIQLIASLCDRISADAGTAGADIAFSLITAMIVLS
jgi:hypothetical protein